MLYNHKVILASGSPRRRELIGYLFKNNEVLRYPCDEPVWVKGQAAKHYLKECIEEKWRSALIVLVSPGDALLLVADTIVVQGNRVLGKPRDAAEARAMLQSLSMKPHRVWTSFRIGRADGSAPSIERVVESRVSFRKLTDKEIRDYVKSGEPMDKAGAYGFQGIGMQNIASIDGPYTNIVGLPLDELRRATQELGIA
ncbi:MAG: Maf family protein [Bdellovibrionota bacterium]